MTIIWKSHSNFEYSIYVPNTTASKFKLKKFAAELKKMQGCELIIVNSIQDSTHLGNSNAVIKLTLSNFTPITAYIPTIQKVVDAHLRVFVAPAPTAKKRKADSLENLATRAAAEAQMPTPFYLAPTVIKNARRFVFQPSVTSIPEHLFGNLNPATALAVIKNPIEVNIPEPAQRQAADPLENLAARAAAEAEIPPLFHLAPTVIKNARRFVFQPSVTSIPEHLFGNLNPETALPVIKNPIEVKILE